MTFFLLVGLIPVCTLETEQDIYDEKIHFDHISQPSLKVQCVIY